MNFCDGGERFGISTNDLCIHPQFVTSCDALLPSVMRRESQRRSACGERLYLRGSNASVAPVS